MSGFSLYVLVYVVVVVHTKAGTVESGEYWGGGRHTFQVDRYYIMLPLNIFKTKFPSLLIRFIMTFDGKYITSKIDVSSSLFKNYFLLKLIGWGFRSLSPPPPPPPIRRA